jgi:thiosulfate reductase cytochrome b subunit
VERGRRGVYSQARQFRGEPVGTGLAIAAGFTAVWPATVTLLGGRQSARARHFAVSAALTLFLLGHLLMLVLAGFTHARGR